MNCRKTTETTKINAPSDLFSFRWLWLTSSHAILPNVPIVHTLWLLFLFLVDIIFWNVRGQNLMYVSVCACNSCLIDVVQHHHLNFNRLRKFLHVRWFTLSISLLSSCSKQSKRGKKSTIHLLQPSNRTFSQDFCKRLCTDCEWP